jgi:RNA polymerase sigma factor (sigma-70 family)
MDSSGDEPQLTAPAAADLAQYHDKVHKLARRLRARYQLQKPLNELVSAGFAALYDRAKHKHHEYDPAKGTFWAFVSPGIEGAMWSDVARDGLSRKAYAFAQAHSTARASAFSADDKPTDRELIRDFLTIAENTRLGFRLFMQAPPPRAAAPDSPEDEVAARELRAKLQAAVDALPERHRVMVRQRFQDGLALAEIGTQFDISESRVAHVLREALNTLRASLVADDS